IALTGFAVTEIPSTTASCKKVIQLTKGSEVVLLRSENEDVFEALKCPSGVKGIPLCSAETAHKAWILALQARVKYLEYFDHCTRNYRGEVDLRVTQLIDYQIAVEPCLQLLANTKSACYLGQIELRHIKQMKFNTFT